MKIEVGKSYETRNGGVVKVTMKNGNKFIGTEDSGYESIYTWLVEPDGRIIFSDGDRSHDLIKEIPDNNSGR